jgi:hypothetical protein
MRSLPRKSLQGDALLSSKFPRALQKASHEEQPEPVQQMRRSLWSCQTLAGTQWYLETHAAVVQKHILELDVLPVP